MTTLRVHGIPNCDTVRRARAWLAGQGAAYDFVDFKKAAPGAADLQRWAAAVGWERLLNRQGNIWRSLDAASQAAVVDAASAGRLMQAQPSVIKRPVVEWPDGVVTIGFAPEAWAARLAAGAATAT